MTSPFSTLINYGVESQFRKDPSGRTVFLPFGRRKKAYFVESKSDEDKIRSFVKMYRCASTLLSWLGTAGIYVFGWNVTFHTATSTIPVWTRLTPFLVSSLVYLLIMVVWAWILWGVYKETVQGMTSSLIEVGPDVKAQLSGFSPQRRLVLVFLLAALVLLGVGVCLAVSSSRPACPANGTSTRSR